MSEAEILFERRGAAGLVTLNRPQALHALTLGMVRALAAQLDAWKRDASISRIVLTAAPARAFCAGGDIRHLYDLGRAGRLQEAQGFFREEYTLNAAIKHYPKPYVSLIDGIVMGGGVGLSAHGSHRVAGDRFQFAMPEVGIGFFPDVGGTFVLTHLPGETGTYCGLTGERLNAADAVAAGLATHRIASARFAELLDALCGATPVDAVLAAFAEPPAGDGPVLAHRPLIDQTFAGDTVEAILAALDAAASGSGEVAAFAGRTAATMRTKSPTSLRLTLAQLRRGRDLAFDATMVNEFRIVSRVLHGHDLYEGVRALIVDKDNSPRWRPAELAAVSDAVIDEYFVPLGPDDLVLP